MVQFDKYEIFKAEKSGRGLRATHFVKSGEEILREEPLVKTLINAKFRGVRCDYCFAEPEKLLKCSKCKFVSYCGKDCQTGDWAIHKHECKCLVKVTPKQPPDICRLVSHLLFKYYTPSSKNNDICAGDKKEIETLMDNRDQISSARKEAFFTFSGVLYDYLRGCSFTSETDIYGLLCRISCNSFTITNSELNSLGTGLYKTSSMLNHSCDPNCVAIFEGTTVSIRSIKDLEPGQELLISYVNLMATSLARQNDLKEGYMFNCDCVVCNGKGVNDFMMNSYQCPVSDCSCLQTLHDESEKKCSCNKDCQRNEVIANEANTCVDELEALYNEINIIPTPAQRTKLEKLIIKGEKLLGQCNIGLVHCYEVAMDGCLDVNDWQGALELSKKLEKPYLVFLTKYHPSIGLHYFKQGKLELQLDNVRRGVTSLQKAMKVLQVSHGEGNSLVRLLRQTLDDANYELHQREKVL